MPTHSRTQAILDAGTAALKAAIGDSSSINPKLADASFYQFKFPWNVGITHPACLIVPVQERLNLGTNAQDDYGHGFQVVLTQLSNRDVTGLVAGSMDTLFYWRELAMGVFNQKRMPGMTQVHCVVEPGLVFDPQSFSGNYDASSFVVRCNIRVTR